MTLSSSDDDNMAPLCSLHRLFVAHHDEERRANAAECPSFERAAATSEHAAVKRRLDVPKENAVKRQVYRTSTNRVALRDVASDNFSASTEGDEETVDPFVERYRRELEAEALAATQWAAVTVRDERGFRCPYVVEEKNTAMGERRVLKPRASGAPTRFDKSSYLGHGAFGAVFLVTLEATACAVKVEEIGKRKKLSRIPWEARILDLFWSRDSSSGCFVTRPALLWLWQDGHALSMPAYEANLGDALRAVKQLPQNAALFYAASALEAVRRVHRARILHCDIKPDNFMLAFPSGPTFAAGLVSRGTVPALTRLGFKLVLVDFGRAIDLDRHDPKTTFASCKTHVDEYIWPPAKRGAARWRTQIDTYALGVLLHVLACGRVPAAAPRAQNARRRRAPPKPPLPRGWDAAFWASIFDTLLDDDPTTPPLPDSRVADLAANAAATLDTAIDAQPTRFDAMLDSLHQLRRNLAALPPCF